MSFSPATAECTEGFAFSHTISVTTQYVTEIQSVTPSFSNNQFSNVVITKGLTSFSVSGTYNDVFDREMRYVNTNKDRVTVTRWAEIPTDFNALYKFKPPSTEFIDQVYTVVYKTVTPGVTNLDGTPGTPTTSTHTEQFTLTIRHSWQSDTVMINNLTKAGKYYKHALEVGKVDE